MAGNDTFNTARAERQIARILAALAEPHTLPQLMAKLHLGRATLYRYLRHLGDDNDRRVRIAKYERTEGCKAPVYALGNAPDAPCPPKDDRKTRRKRERASLLADVERLDRHKAKKRIQKKLAKVRKAPQSWLSALM